MESSREDLRWLLLKVKACCEDTERRAKIGAPRWGSSRRYIFLGCYDVWYDESDGPKYNQIMIDRLNEGRDLGYITNETGTKEWKYNENWFLTEKGEEFLKCVEQS